MKPTERQLRLAGKLYGLALLAQMDAGEGESLYEVEVRKHMRQQAARALRRLGISIGSIQTEDDAVRFAQALKPLT